MASACLTPDDALALAAGGSRDGAIDHVDGCAACRRWVLELAVVAAQGGDSVLAAGDVVGRFLIEGLLGRGAHGEVYLARDPTLGRRVAIKFLRWDRAWTDEARARFRREAQAMATVRHPAVVAVHDVGEHQVDGELVPYVVMEHVGGGTLAEATTWPLARRRALLHQLAGGLAAVHAAGLLHRDVKPANVLLDEHGHPKLADFGLSAPHDRAAPGRIGTPGYMAPEVWEGQAPTAASDQYSLGRLAKELLGGSVPAPLARALEPRPEDRWPSMAELARVLQPGRNARRVLAVAAVLLAAGAALLVLFHEPRRPLALPGLAPSFCNREAGRLVDARLSCQGLPAAAVERCQLVTGQLAAITREWNRATLGYCGSPETGGTDAPAVEFCFRQVGEATRNLVRFVSRPGFDWHLAEAALVQSPSVCLLAPRSLPDPPPQAMQQRVIELATELGLENLASTGSPAEAERRASSRLEEARRLDYAPLLARVLQAQAVAVMARDPARAGAILQEALIAADRGRDEASKITILAHLAMLAANRGDEAQGALYLAQARALAAASRVLDPILLNVLLVLEPGTIDEASLEDFLAGLRPSRQIEVRAAYTAGLAAAGDLAALHQAGRLLAALGSQRDTPAALIARMAILEAYDRIGHAPEAIAAATALLAVLPAGMPYPRAFQVLATASAAHGDAAAAARWLGELCRADAAECEATREIIDRLHGELGRARRRLLALQAPRLEDLPVALQLGDWRLLARLLRALPPPATARERYLVAYYQARLWLGRGMPFLARAAITMALAIRQHELRGSPGVEEDLDVVLAARLAAQAGDLAGARAMLDDAEAELGAHDHLVAQLLLARAELLDGAEKARWLAAAAEAIARFERAAPLEARPLRAWWRDLAR